MIDQMHATNMAAEALAKEEQDNLRIQAELEMSKTELKEQRDRLRTVEQQAATKDLEI